MRIDRVVYDEGCYDVLDERGYDADDLHVVYLGDLVRRHPILGSFATLADGHGASSRGTQEPVTDHDRHQSIQAWRAVSL